MWKQSQRLNPGIVGKGLVGGQILLNFLIWTVPHLWFVHTILTGILESFRNASSASREPSVEAWTNTPRSFVLKEFITVDNLSSISSLHISTSSGWFATKRLSPAIHFSSSFASIFTPWAARNCLWWSYWFCFQNFELQYILLKCIKLGKL